MSNIPVHLLYTLLGVFSFICALAIALFKQDKNKSHWILTAIQIVWSLRMLVYAQLFNPEYCHMIWTWPVYIIASMAYAPLFYLFMYAWAYSSDSFSSSSCFAFSDKFSL